MRLSIAGSEPEIVCKIDLLTDLALQRPLKLPSRIRAYQNSVYIDNDPLSVHKNTKWTVFISKNPLCPVQGVSKNNYYFFSKGSGGELWKIVEPQKLFLIPNSLFSKAENLIPD